MAGFRRADSRMNLTITKRSDGCFTSPPRARRRTCTSSTRRSMFIEDRRRTARPHSRASSNRYHRQFFHTPRWQVNEHRRIEPVRNEQVRKRGLPPLVQSKQRRGQAPLPDLFISNQVLFNLVILSPWTKHN